MSVTKAGGESFTVSGALGTDGHPVLISINNLAFSQGAELKGKLLVYQSQSPETLGAVVRKYFEDSRAKANTSLFSPRQKSNF